MNVHLKKLSEFVVQILDAIFVFTTLLSSMLWIAGKGTYRWKSTGGIYDGDWKYGKRNGFGTLSFPDKITGKYKKQYSGGWKNDKTHVCPTEIFAIF